MRAIAVGEASIPRIAPSSPEIRLSVVIVTYNSRGDIQAALPALVDQLSAQDELIVVDNASRDDTLEAVARIAPDAVLLPAGWNSGFAAGCNAPAPSGPPATCSCSSTPTRYRDPAFVSRSRAPRSTAAAGPRGWAL